MKHLIATLLLLVATAAVTVIYFRSLNTPGKGPAELMQHIPNDASLVLEFSNANGFYDAFSSNQLFSSIIGPQKTAELSLLKKILLGNAVLKEFFANQHIFLSLHATDDNQLEFLVTTSPGNKFTGKVLDKLVNLQTKGFKITKKNTGVEVNMAELDRPFYLAENDSEIITGSFSEQLVKRAALYNYKEHKDNFLQLSNQQNENALAILYINNGQLPTLFQQLFIAQNPELLRPLRLLHAKAALSLNYKTNALMFNGLTEVTPNVPTSYLNLFSSQQPVQNTLKQLLPATTAYSSTFGISNTAKFSKDLADKENKAGFAAQKRELFSTIKTQTGVSFEHDLNHSIANGFTIITTRFMERLAIIQLTENQQLLPSLVNISTMQSDNIGQFNYSKIPFFLLGDAFTVFDKPYFILINNYLVLANTPGELRSYYDTYNNQKFLSKTAEFDEFDNLLAERSNVSFFINFKNIKPVLRQDLKPKYFGIFNNNEPGFKNFYGACYQLAASDKNFYTNLCIKLTNTKTSSDKN